ncbi:MAG: phosphatase PAP2 family protein [Candidatus Hydrogenedens sp.]|nr:phosphatase PAP2 family protein [Candidatus Hydrogenedens sp.]
MNVWVSRGTRIGGIAAGTAVIWAVVQGFGLWVMPRVHDLDMAFSAAMNPDNYVPGVDEFFRAYTDYSNLIIALPLVSLAIAIGLYNLVRMSSDRAVRWSLITCLLWGCVIGLLALAVGDKAKPPLVIGLGSLAPVLILIGAVPPLLLKNLNPKRWVGGVMVAEIVLLIVLWATHKLFWNDGLPGANYLLLPALLVAHAGALAAFLKMDDARIGRFIGVFWLVLLASIITDVFVTNTIKESIARPRPLSDSYQPSNDVLRAIPEETLKGNNSYPSGHTSGTFALITPLFWWVRGRKSRTAILSLGALQAASRVYTVAHFLSDVLMGGLLGFGIGTLVFFLLGGPALRGPDAEPEPEQAA